MVELVIITSVISYIIGIIVGRCWEKFTEE